MTESSSPPITELAIGLIEVDPKNSPRDGIDDARVEEFRAIVDRLPPVLVYCTKPGKYVLSAGFHRLAAHQAEQRDTIKAEVRKGTKREARIAGMLSDLKAAKWLTVEERRRAIETVAELMSDMSNGVVADLCGCSSETVRLIRKSGSKVLEPETVTGKDGRTYAARKSSSERESDEETPSDGPSDEGPPHEPDDLQHESPATCPECGDELTPGEPCAECAAAAAIEVARNRPVDPIPPAADEDVQVVTDNLPPRAPKPVAERSEHICPDCGETRYPNGLCRCTRAPKPVAGVVEPPNPALVAPPSTPAADLPASDLEGCDAWRTCPPANRARLRPRLEQAIGLYSRIAATGVLRVLQQAARSRVPGLDDRYSDLWCLVPRTRPSDWTLCDGCRGAGVKAGHPCDVCKGGGFRVE